jgi:hypothetical protein
MTKKERLNIYKKAYNHIESGDNSYMCHAIERQTHTFYYSNDWENNFPEFYAMSPNDDVLNFRDAWFDDTRKELRLTILAFCIAMCED